MKILILDSSSRSASAAICEDGRLLGEYYTNNGKTHSATLLPMTEGLLRTCSLTIGEMDAPGGDGGAGLLYRAAHRHGRRQGNGLCRTSALHPPLHFGGTGLEPAGNRRPDLPGAGRPGEPGIHSAVPLSGTGC